MHWNFSDNQVYSNPWVHACRAVFGGFGFLGSCYLGVQPSRNGPRLSIEMGASW